MFNKIQLCKRFKWQKKNSQQSEIKIPLINNNRNEIDSYFLHLLLLFFFFHSFANKKRFFSWPCVHTSRLLNDVKRHWTIHTNMHKSIKRPVNSNSYYTLPTVQISITSISKIFICHSVHGLRPSFWFATCYCLKLFCCGEWRKDSIKQSVVSWRWWRWCFCCIFSISNSLSLFRSYALVIGRWSRCCFTHFYRNIQFYVFYNVSFFRLVVIFFCCLFL